MNRQRKSKLIKSNRIDLNPFNLNVHFLSSFDSELGGWFWRTIPQIIGSTQSTILYWNIFRPYKSNKQNSNFSRGRIGNFMAKLEQRYEKEKKTVKTNEGKGEGIKK